jgi:hypothetical protein
MVGQVGTALRRIVRPAGRWRTAAGRREARVGGPRWGAATTAGRSETSRKSTATIACRNQEEVASRKSTAMVACRNQEKVSRRHCLLGSQLEDLPRTRRVHEAEPRRRNVMSGSSAVTTPRA